MFASDIHNLLKRLEFDQVTKRLQATSEESDDQIRNFKDEDGFSLIHWAAMAEHIELLLFCLDHLGMSVDLRGRNLQTPLLWAAMDEKLLALTLLLDRGADIDARDDLGT